MTIFDFTCTDSIPANNWISSAFYYDMKLPDL
jgi:hypothetical protein